MSANKAHVWEGIGFFTKFTGRVRIFRARIMVGCIIHTREFDGNFKATRNIDNAATDQEAKRAGGTAPMSLLAHVKQDGGHPVVRSASGPRVHVKVR